MIYGLGTDIVEVKRVADKVGKDNGFKEKTFSQTEIAYCEAKKNPAQHYAGKFAAKEAMAKAMGTGWYGQCEITDLEVLNDEKGKPSLHVKNILKEIIEKENITNLHLSISHTTDVAMATVVLECK